MWIGVLSGAASAQVATRVGGVPALQPRLMQGIDDQGPLGTSLQPGTIDLRTDNGWESVYSVPNGDGLLMRRAGGLSAVFTRSDYIPTRDGILTAVPPGVIFCIGDPTPLTVGKAWTKPQAGPAVPHALSSGPLAERIDTSFSGLTSGDPRVSSVLPEHPSSTGAPTSLPQTTLPRIDTEQGRWEVLWSLRSRLELTAAAE